MDATTYTGTGTTQAIVNNGPLQPDFLWTKSRSTASTNLLLNSITGVTKYLESNSTNAETTDSSNFLASFNSNGFTQGTGNYANGVTVVGWQWKAGANTTTTNTSGTITSTVSANTTAGFSIVSWTATGSVATVGHGLGAKPSIILTKQRSAAGDWAFITDIITGTPQYLYLNTTQAINNTGWGTNPTTTVFSGYSYPSGQTIVSYCWTPIAGYSQFGSYTGNGSTDGAFVYTGFRPKFVMIKRTDTTADWATCDSTRNPYNKVTAILFPNTADAEATADIFQFFSNGFKLNQTGGGANANGGNYIYMAFASTPFKYSNAF